MEGFRIVLFSMGLAVLYGLVHDQVAVLLWLRRGRLGRDAGRLGALVLLLAATGALTGCLEQQVDVRVERTGAGTLRQDVTVVRADRDDLLRRFAALYGATEEPGVLPFADPFHPRWVRARARGVKGVSLARVERAEDDGRPTTAVEASFDSLESAARADLFFPASVRLERLVPEKDADPRWRLTLRNPWAEAAGAKDGTLGGKPFAEVLGAVRPALQSLRLERVIHLPTRVLSTSGVLGPQRRTVTWRQTTADIEAGRGLHLVVVFEHVEGLVLAPFRHRPDPDALMERALEAPPGVTPPESKPPPQK